MPHCSLPPANVVCEGYVFTRVCHSVHKGGGCYPSMHCRWYTSTPCSRSRGVISQHALQVSRPTPSGEVEGDLGGGSPGPHPRGKFRVSQVHTQGGLQAHTWGCLQDHTCGVSIPACTEADTPPDGYCCGRYASYWNAFLLAFVN